MSPIVHLQKNGENNEWQTQILMIPSLAIPTLGGLT
jgi:hypothetical protein